MRTYYKSKFIRNKRDFKIFNIKSFVENTQYFFVFFLINYLINQYSNYRIDQQLT